MSALDFDTIYREHVQRVTRWTGWLVRSPSDVEDVVQDVFMTAHRLLPGFRGDAQVSTWLFRLTANAARHHRRRRARLRWLQLGARALAISEPTATSPDDELASSRELDLVRQALDALPEKYRTVLILSRLEGLSGGQIAALTQTKLATVWVRLHRARSLLAKQITTLRARASERSEPRHAHRPVGGPT